MAAGEVMQALRILLLPMRSGSEAVCGRALSRSLLSQGIARADFASWIRLELGIWRDTKIPSRQFKQVVTAVLSAPNSEGANSVAAEYFSIHSRLVLAHHMKHDEAISFLSHLFLIHDLAKTESLAALAGRIGRNGFCAQERACALDSTLAMPHYSARCATRCCAAPWAE